MSWNGANSSVMETQLNDDIQVSRLFFLLRRRAWIILAVGVAAGLVAFVYASLQPELFRATAEVNTVDQTAGLFRNSGEPDPQRSVNNALYLARSRAVQDPAKATLGDAASSIQSITASSDPNTDVMAVTVVADDPEVARNAANAVVDVYVERQEALNVQSRKLQAADLRQIADDLNSQIDALDQSLARAESGTDLEALRLERTRLITQQADNRTRANQLDTEAELKSGAISVLVPATTPTEPFAPTPLRDAGIAALVGLLLGTAAVILFDWINNRVGSPEEASRLSGGLPIVGTIPLAGAKKLRRRHLPDGPRQLVELGSAADEAYRSLATNVRFSAVGRTSTRIAVTSAGPGEGKTTVVANLARTLALAGSKVAVISADLRRPALGAVFDIDEGGLGLTTVLLGESTLPESVQQVEFLPGVTLAFLPTGPQPGNPPAVLASAAMGDVLNRIEAAGADIIILDTAPVLPVTDTLVLVQHCDSVILSVVPEATKKAQVTEAVNRLRKVEVEILGIVLDGVTQTALGYYGFGEGAYGARPPAEREGAAPKVPG